ncbi:MAG: hypothetical protein WC809_18695 [Sinimarinibacterium sp.]|jgi:hypothetical protein
MSALADFLRLLRYAQAVASVRYHHWDLDRAKTGLAKAYLAHDMAVAELHIASTPPTREPSASLLIGNAGPMPRKFHP